MVEAKTREPSSVRDRLQDLGVPTKNIEAVLELIDGKQNQPTTETHAGENGANGHTRTIRVRKFVEVEVPEIPDGYLRFRDAATQYGVLKGTLSTWVRRNHVRVVRVSREQVYVSEEDLRARLGRDQ